jgi:choline transport protein
MSSPTSTYNDTKTEDRITVSLIPTPLPLPSSDHGNNTKDDEDMRRLGKTQELDRNFHWFHTLAFTTVIMATWEILLIVNNQALTDGGRPGFLYSYIWSCVGFAPIVVSLAEMSSM